MILCMFYALLFSLAFTDDMMFRIVVLHEGARSLEASLPAEFVLSGSLVGHSSLVSR